jgi:hypothetical protein
LSIVTTNIDEYVEQTRALREIVKVLPVFRTQINIINDMFSVCGIFNIELTKDD